MAVDTKTVKELREKTGMGISACKNALVEADGDLDQAELVLLKAGIDKAAKKAERATGEGVIAVKTEGNAATIIEVGCEQEPTTNNDRFKEFVHTALDLAFAGKSAAVDDLLQQATPAGTLRDTLTNLVAVTSENIQIKRVGRLEATGGGVIGKYVHFNHKAGAVCALKLNGADAGHAAVQTAANDVCLHAVAARPLALKAEDIPAEVLAKEKEVFADQIQGKPENIQEKILAGKLKKFYQEKCLLEQVFVRDPEGKQTVAAMVAAAGKTAGGAAEVVAFLRFELGNP